MDNEQEVTVEIEYDPWPIIFPTVLGVLGKDALVQCEEWEKNRLQLLFGLSGVFAIVNGLVTQHSPDRLIGVPRDVLDIAALAVDYKAVNALKYWKPRIQNHCTAIQAAIMVCDIRNFNAFFEAAEALMRGEQ